MALSAAAGLVTRNTTGKTVLEPTVETGSKIWKHALVVTNATGTAQPAANDTTTKFVGLAAATVASGDGTLTAECISNIDVQITLQTSVTVGMVGDAMYAVDDASVHQLTTLGAEVGVLVEYTSANLGWVRLGMKALAAGA
jgi:hypothetical protein